MERRLVFYRVRWLLLLVALAVAAPVFAETWRWTPRMEGRVTDIANVLSEVERQRLTEMLASYEAETTHQFAILTVPTVHPEGIDDFSVRVANAWKIGRKEYNNGVLVVLAVGDRAVRIEVGLGMERYISHETAKGIIDEVMIPAFRSGRYVEGLQAGLTRLMVAGRKFVVPGARAN